MSCLCLVWFGLIFALLEGNQQVRQTKLPGIITQLETLLWTYANCVNQKSATWGHAEGKTVAYCETTMSTRSVVCLYFSDLKK